MDQEGQHAPGTQSIGPGRAAQGPRGPPTGPPPPPMGPAPPPPAQADPSAVGGWGALLQQVTDTQVAMQAEKRRMFQQHGSALGRIVALLHVVMIPHNAPLLPPPTPPSAPVNPKGGGWHAGIPAPIPPQLGTVPAWAPTLDWGNGTRRGQSSQGKAHMLPGQDVGGRDVDGLARGMAVKEAAKAVFRNWNQGAGAVWYLLRGGEATRAAPTPAELAHALRYVADTNAGMLDMLSRLERFDVLYSSRPSALDRRRSPADTPRNPAPFAMHVKASVQVFCLLIDYGTGTAVGTAKLRRDARKAKLQSIKGRLVEFMD